MSDADTNNLRVSLLLLRLGVFLVMFMWTIDKFVNPGHAARVYANFYHIAGLESVVMYAIGAVEMVLLLLFLSVEWIGYAMIGDWVGMVAAPTHLAGAVAVGCRASGRFVRAR